jgi:sugar/nucleoside kinase (ribokinase family)
VRLISVGDVMLDITCAGFPPQGERLHADISIHAGGSAVNAAVAARAWGAQATVIGRVGADAAGDLVAGELAAREIGSLLARDPELMTGATVALSAKGQVSVVADRGANARLARADVPDPLEGDALLVSGFALFQVGSAEAAVASLERFTGKWAGVDLASPKLAAAADLDGAAARANVVFATADEAKAVTGAEPGDAARALGTRFQLACVKLGPEGALVAHGGRMHRSAASSVVRTAPFGAGDAFAAAFLLSLAGGGTTAEALERACEAGARAASPASPR